MRIKLLGTLQINEKIVVGINDHLEANSSSDQRAFVVRMDEVHVINGQEIPIVSHSAILAVDEKVGDFGEVSKVFKSLEKVVAEAQKEDLTAYAVLEDLIVVGYVRNVLSKGREALVVND